MVVDPHAGPRASIFGLTFPSGSRPHLASVIVYTNRADEHRATTNLERVYEQTAKKLGGKNAAGLRTLMENGAESHGRTLVQWDDFGRGSGSREILNACLTTANLDR